MLKPDVIQFLGALASPVLTVYLDTDQAKQTNRGLKPVYLILLESEAKLIAQAVSRDEQEVFQKQLRRTEDYLEKRPPRSRGIVVFAGKDTWEFVPLQVKVENEVHWGVPSLAQLVWLLDEHKQYGVVVSGRKRTRFFLYWLGEFRELQGKEFRLEPSKKKDMGPVSRPGVRLSHGTNRDVFEHHLAAQYAHYHQQIAERIGRWIAAEQLEAVYLVGLAKMAKAIRKAVSPTLIDKVVLIGDDLGWASRTELLDRIEPAIVSHKQKCEMALVKAMLGDSRNIILGLDEVLAQVQQGKIRRVLVSKGLNGSLQQCVKCSWVDRASDPICPACGGRRESVALRDVLPQLVRRHNASLKIVSGQSARMLEAASGMAAWLREFEKKEYSASA